MSASTIYIIVSLLAIAVVALLVFLTAGKDRRNRLTPLAGLAFSFVTAGIIFGDDRLIGYGLMGIGFVLAVIDIIFRMKKKK